ncbi:hypothetical protein TRVL_03037 [Trypanosoma vivax]|nr:hypothetical protein TRVL_03037 [Trypanosoma vivax]
MISRPEEVKKTPRTRGGGVFMNLSEIRLHTNDFSWDNKMSELSNSEKTLVEEYIKQCEDSLESMISNKGDIFLSSHTYKGFSWDSHYQVNKHHFPLKNYILLAFPMLRTICSRPAADKCYVVECGCGTGSTLLPIIRQFKNNIHFIAFDISESAISALLEHPIAKECGERNQLTAFQFDISGSHKFTLDEPERSRRRIEVLRLKNSIMEKVPACSSVDAVLLVFVLSSLPSIQSMLYALKEINSILKDDGILLFRDYAVPDNSLLRFTGRNNPKFNAYSFCKGDGTLQMFYELNFAKKLFALAGFVEIEGHELEYHCNRIVNRKNHKRMDKIFLNGTFRPARNS